MDSDAQVARRTRVDSDAYARRLAEVVRETQNLRTKAHTLSATNHELSLYMLSYDHHREQLTALALLHAPTVLLVLMFALIAGHTHVAQVVGLVYVPVFVAFVVALFAVGVRTSSAAVMRFFGLALFALSATNAVAVVYAALYEFNMDTWVDWVLGALLVFDLCTCGLYFYTADQVAGAGGHISVLELSLHETREVVSPVRSRIGSSPLENNIAALQRSWVQRAAAAIGDMFTPRPPRRRRGLVD